MYELKKMERYLFTSKFVGTGPSSYEKRIYRTAISQSLRNTGIKHIGKKSARRRVLEVWWLESPEPVRRGTCERVVGLEYSWRGSSPLGSVGVPLLALALGGRVCQLVSSWCTRLHAWLCLCHRRGRRCERCCVRGPSRVAVKDRKFKFTINL